ncbi:MAG: hypothetical protein ABIQ18_08715 [Umezawaea sp.]
MKAFLVALMVVATFALPVEVSAAPTTRTLEIVTVPPLPSARFLLDGQVLVPDDRGVVKLVLPRSQDKHRLELTTPRTEGAAGTIDFVRWFGQSENDQGFTPILTDLVLSHNRRLQAAFQSSRVVRYDFVDQAHNRLAPERVTALTLRSDAGQTQTLHGVREVRLTGFRPVQEGATAVAKDVTYYLQSVEIDGANVVNAGEQRLVPTRASAATFVVLLRSVHFQARDLLFGDAMDARVELGYPDGRTTTLTAGEDGDIAIADLARGKYRVEVAAAGYVGDQEIVLSRSQYVELRILSYVDIAVIGGVLILVAVGLVLLGRRRLRIHRTQQAEVVE